MVVRADHPATPSSRPGALNISPKVLVIRLALTLGFYGFAYVWQVSKQVDQFGPVKKTAYRPAKWAPVGVLLASNWWLSAAMLVFALGDEMWDPPHPAVIGFIAAGMVAWIVGWGLAAESFWRITKAVRAEQRRLGRQPFGLWSILYLGLVPLVNGIVFPVIVYKVHAALLEVLRVRAAIETR